MSRWVSCTGAGGTERKFTGMTPHQRLSVACADPSSGYESIAGSAAQSDTVKLEARSAMGKYGLSPSDVTFIVSQKRYYDLIADAGFADITDVGSDVATKLVGSIGSVYGTPILISDNFAATETTSTDIAYAVNTSNFVIPRLRGVNVEQDYEVREQRRLVVASQSLGFDRLFGATSNNVAAFAIKPVT